MALKEDLRPCAPLGVDRNKKKEDNVSSRRDPDTDLIRLKNLPIPLSVMINVLLVNISVFLYSCFGLGFVWFFLLFFWSV